MELRDLRALVHVADAGTLSGAAGKLNLTQPAMSALIRRLEDELDTPILVRHSRGVGFTEEGRFLLERARQILADVASARSALRELGEEPVGEVRVGLPTSVGSGLVPELLPRLRARYPRIRLNVSEQMSGNLTEMLQLGRLDMAMLFDIQPMPGLRSEPVLLEEIELLVAPDDPLAWHESVTLEDIARRQIVLPSPNHSLRQLVERAAATEGVRLNVYADLDSFFGLVGAVHNGFPTLLPTFLVQHLIRAGDVRAVPVSRPPLSWTLHLATRLDSVRPRAALLVGRIIAETCADLIRSGAWPGRLHPRGVF
jgi:DNA-binding transcriptional LysR family regulator